MKMKGIYIGLDKGGNVPIICNCSSCQRQRKEWGEKPYVRPKESITIEAAVEKLSDDGINVILLSLPSEIIYQSVLNLKKSKPIWDKDYLKVLVEKSHQKKIHVYPVLGGFSAYIKERPEWRMVNEDGKKVPYADPARPEVKDFVIRAIVNLVKQYDFEGVSLDFLRYPEMELTGDCCYCEYCRKVFEKKYDFDPIVLKIKGKREQSLITGQYLWRKEREDNITQFVKEIKDAILEVRKDIKLSSYVWGYASYLVFQNWIDWLEKKLLDWINPSGYDYDIESFKRRCVELAVMINKRCPSYITLGQHTSHGRVKNVEELKEQMKIADKTGFEGYMFFSHTIKSLLSYLSNIK